MLITIYIIAYNHEKYISAAIDGVLSQTYSPLEIIISDDCSTDRTWDIILQKTTNYVGKHKIVLLRNSQNLGISAHINNIWKHATGQWIVASAGDDVSETSRVETIVAAIKKHPEVKLFQSYLTEIDEKGHVLYVNSLKVNKWNVDQDNIYLPKRFEYGSFSRHGAAMAYSREIVDIFGSLPEEVIFEDNIVDVRAEILGGCGVIAKPLVRHRNHDDQITNNYISRNPKKVYERIQRRLKSDLITTKTNYELVKTNISRVKINLNILYNYKYKKIISYYRYQSLFVLKPLNIVYLIIFLLLRDKSIKISKRELMAILLPYKIFIFLLKSRT